MGAAYDLERLRAALRSPWTGVRHVAETGSTNADLLAAPDGPTGEVLLTDHQTAGRGRLDRRWEEPAGSSVMLSVRLRPQLPPARRGWLPMLAGVAVADAITGVAPGVGARLKWPNDVLIGDDGRKVAGILAEAQGDVLVVGVGCNVAQSSDELPVPTATSLALHGVDLDRTALVADLLGRLGDGLDALTRAGGDATASGLAAAYTARCDTVGRAVTVTRPGGEVRGRATRIGDDAALVVVTDAGETAVLAGDVTHLRAESV